MPKPNTKNPENLNDGNQNRSTGMPPEDFEKLEKYERIRKTMSSFLAVESDYAEENKAIDEAEEAYFSNSWPEEIRRRRKSAGKPTSDVAQFPPIVDGISGNQLQSPVEPHAFDIGDDDRTLTDTVNLYLRHRTNRAKDEANTDLAFQSGITTRRYHIEFFLKQSKLGTLDTVCIERDPRTVFIKRPFKRYDARDSEMRFHAEWISPHELKAMYAGEDIDWSELEVSREQARQVQKESTHSRDEYLFPDMKNPGSFYSSDDQDVRLIRVWRKEYENIFQVIDILDPERPLEESKLAEFNKRKDAVDYAKLYLVTRSSTEFAGGDASLMETDDMLNVIQTLPEEVQELFDDPDIEKEAKNMVVRYEREYYSYHVISGRLELEWEPDIGDELPWADFFAYFMNGKSDGLFGRLKDEIRDINLIYAKFMDRLGKIGKMPIGIKKGALAMQADAAQKAFEQGKFIFFQDDSNMSEDMHPFEDKTLSSFNAYTSLLQLKQEALSEKSGFNEAIQGNQPSANTSGVAIELLQNKGAAMIAPLLANHHKTLQIMARVEISMLKRQYELQPLFTTKKIERIVRGMLKKAPSDIQFEDLRKQLEQDGEEPNMSEVLKKLDWVEFESEIDQIVRSPSMKIAIANTLVNVAGTLGYHIDPNVIYGLIDMPESIRQKLSQSTLPTAGAGGELAQALGGGLPQSAGGANVQNGGLT